jgi:hypothetical protein
VSHRRPIRQSNAAAVAAIIALLVGGCLVDGDPSERAGQFLEAYSTYRIPDALALVTDDVLVRERDGGTLQGRAALRSRMGWDSVVSTQFRVTELRTRGDTVALIALTETSTWLQLLGVGYLEYEDAYLVFRGGRIAEFALGLTVPARREVLERQLGRFLPWTQHESPERLSRVFPDGRFDYEPRRAADWLNLLREWAGAAEP